MGRHLKRRRPIIDMTQTDSKKIPADFTQGSVLGSIIKMGTPSMIGFLTGHIYYMVDMWWVSRLPRKEAAVAAITIFSNVAWVFSSINSLIGPGSVAVISRRYGEKDYDRAEANIKETFLLKWFFGTLFGLIGLLFVEDIVYMAGARGETVALSAAYGRVVFMGMGVSLCTYSVYTALRGVANPSLAMGIMILGACLNLALDPLFIFGYFGFPELGVVGAAVASVISYVISFLVGLILFMFGKTNVRVHLKGKIPISLESMLKIIRLGVPAWLGMLSFSGARLVIMPMIAIFGNGVIAAYGIGMQISAIGHAILVGIGLGLAALIGHNLGGDKKERAKRTADQALLLSIGIMVALGMAIFALARPIMRIYFENTETIAYGVTVLRILAVSFPFVGIYIMLEEIYAGVGLNSPAMVVSIGHAWVIEIPAIYILTQVFDFNQDAVWWSITAASMLSAAGFYWYYRRGQWLNVKV